MTAPATVEGVSDHGIWIDGVEYLTRRHAAQHFSVTEDCIRKWASRGFVESRTVHDGRARHHLYPVQHLLDVDRDRRRARAGRPRRPRHVHA